MRVFIHSGHLSIDNGAIFPLTVFFDLARLLGVSADSGVGYWDDSLEVQESEWPTVEGLLVEAKMLYKVDGLHREWQNVQTDEVRRVLCRGTAKTVAVA
jgi:hypothetical protein